MDSPETHGLVLKAKDGDAEAYGQLYALYSSRLYRFIKIKINETATAEDLLQEVFLKAWQALPKLQLSDLHFNAWLYQIARNLVNDYYRRQYRQPPATTLDEIAELPSTSSPLTETILILEIDRVKKHFYKLPPQYREVLELRFIQEFEVSEAAKIMGKSNLAIRLLQHRALKRLQTLLGISYEGI